MASQEALCVCAEDEVRLHTAEECFKDRDQHKSVTKTELWNNKAAEKSWSWKEWCQKGFLNGAWSTKGERLEVGWEKQRGDSMVQKFVCGSASVSGLRELPSMKWQKVALLTW